LYGCRAGVLDPGAPNEFQPLVRWFWFGAGRCAAGWLEPGSPNRRMPSVRAAGVWLLPDACAGREFWAAPLTPGSPKRRNPD
jgi:hypothetical protein